MRNIFKDKKGRWAIWQEPNFNLVLFFFFLAASAVAKHGTANKILSTLAFGTIFIWSWREISEGISPFRRILGAVVMAVAVILQII